MLVFRMKKKHGIKKALDEVPLSELETWKTRKLLVRLKRLRWCYEEVAAAEDYYPHELAAVEDKILFKTDPRWKQAYREVKAILATREHITARI